MRFQNAVKSTETPFVYFVSGTAVYPPNTIYDAANAALARAGEMSLREVLKGLAKVGDVAGTWTVLPEGWWYHFLLRICKNHKEHHRDTANHVEAGAGLGVCTQKPRPIFRTGAAEPRCTRRTVVLFRADEHHFRMRTRTLPDAVLAYRPDRHPAQRGLRTASNGRRSLSEW